MNAQPSHHDAYRSAVVEISLPDGRTVCIAADKGPPDDLSVPFVVLTAWNPASRRRAEWVNAVDQELLEGVIAARGCSALAAVGRAADGSWSERSVAVWGLPTRDALRLGSDFGQNAIFAVTRAGIEVLPCPHLDDQLHDPAMSA